MNKFQAINLMKTEKHCETFFYDSSSAGKYRKKIKVAGVVVGMFYVSKDGTIDAVRGLTGAHRSVKAVKNIQQAYAFILPDFMDEMDKSEKRIALMRLMVSDRHCQRVNGNSCKQWFFKVGGRNVGTIRVFPSGLIEAVSSSSPISSITLGGCRIKKCLNMIEAREFIFPYFAEELEAQRMQAEFNKAYLSAAERKAKEQGLSKLPPGHHVIKLKDEDFL